MIYITTSAYSHWTAQSMQSLILESYKKDERSFGFRILCVFFVSDEESTISHSQLLECWRTTKSVTSVDYFSKQISPYGETVGLETRRSFLELTCLWSRKTV